METIFVLLASLLFGIIIGGVLVTYFGYRFLYLGSYQEEIHKQQEMPLETINIILGKKPAKENSIPQESVTLETFVKTIDSKIKFYNSKEEYEKSAMLKIMLDNCPHWFNKRKKWFLSRVGKKITTDTPHCECDSCRDIYKNGVLVEDEGDAMQFFLLENFSKLEFKDFEFIDFK